MLHQIQAEPAAFRPDPPRSPGLVEAAENLACLPFVDAYAVVFETQLQGAPPRMKTNIDPGAAGLVVFDRIGQQIGEQYFKEWQIDSIRE